MLYIVEDLGYGSKDFIIQLRDSSDALYTALSKFANYLESKNR